MLGRLRANLPALRRAYRLLAADVRAGEPAPPAAEWLLDNFHLIEAEVRGVRHDLPAAYNRKLPRLTGPEHAGAARVEALARELVLQERRAPRRRPPRSVPDGFPDHDAPHSRRGLGLAQLPARRPRRAPPAPLRRAARDARPEVPRRMRSSRGPREDVRSPCPTRRRPRSRRDSSSAPGSSGRRRPSSCRPCRSVSPPRAARSKTRCAPRTRRRPRCRCRSRTRCRPCASAARWTGVPSSSA